MATGSVDETNREQLETWIAASIAARDRNQTDRLNNFVIFSLP